MKARKYQHYGKQIHWVEENQQCIYREFVETFVFIFLRGEKGRSKAMGRKCYRKASTDKRNTMVRLKTEIVRNECNTKQKSRIFRTKRFGKGK